MATPITNFYHNLLLLVVSKSDIESVKVFAFQSLLLKSPSLAYHSALLPSSADWIPSVAPASQRGSLVLATSLALVVTVAHRFSRRFFRSTM